MQSNTVLSQTELILTQLFPYSYAEVLKKKFADRDALLHTAQSRCDVFGLLRVTRETRQGDQEDATFSGGKRGRERDRG